MGTWSCKFLPSHLVEQLHSPTSWNYSSAQSVFCTWGRSSLQCVRTRARCCVMFEHNLIAPPVEQTVCYPSSSTGHFISPTETTDLHSHTICPQLRQHAIEFTKGCFPLQICTHWLEALWIQFRRGCLLRHTQCNSKLWLVFPLWFHSGLHQVGKFLNYRWSASILDIVTHSYMCFTIRFFLVPSNTSIVFPKRKYSNTFGTLEFKFWGWTDLLKCVYNIL